MQQNLASVGSRQVREEAYNSVSVTATTSGNFVRPSRPPPRVPAAKPGRAVGPILRYENGRTVNETYDQRHLRNVPPQDPRHLRNVPPQGFSPQYDSKTNTEKPSPDNPVAKQAPRTANKSPYDPPQGKTSQLNEQIAINAKLLQEQSQLGVVSAAAVAAVARREVGVGIGAVQY